MSKQKSNQIMNRKLFVILRLELQTFALIILWQHSEFTDVTVGMRYTLNPQVITDLCLESTTTFDAQNAMK